MNTGSPKKAYLISSSLFVKLLFWEFFGLLEKEKNYGKIKEKKLRKRKGKSPQSFQLWLTYICAVTALLDFSTFINCKHQVLKLMRIILKSP